MTRYLLGIVAIAAVTLVGCERDTATAPSTDPNRPGETRELTITSPGEQDVNRNGTEKFTIRIDRDNFAGPIEIEIKNLPAGVERVTPTELMIPADQDSMEVTVKANPDAALVNDHKVQIIAWAKDQKDLKEATVYFDMDVRAQ
jgi:hypothetical protein